MSTGSRAVNHSRKSVIAIPLILLVCIFSLFALTSSAHATVLEPLTIEQLAERAATIVVADTVGMQSRFSRVGQGGAAVTLPHTFVDLQVVDVLKGSVASGITVPVLGGSVGDYRVEVEGMPEFTPGETCLLFLDPQGRVIGGAQGKLDIAGGQVERLSQSMTAVKARIDRALSAGAAPTVGVASSADVAPSAVSTSSVELAGIGLLATPTITGISPGSAPAGIGARVTITGSGFGSSPGSVNFYYRSGLTINGPIYYWSDTSIVVEVPVGEIQGYPASAGSGPVTVTTASGQKSAGYNFNVQFSYGTLKWLTSSVSFRVNANCYDTTQERAMIDAAAATWTAAADFAFVDMCACSTTYPVSNDGHNDMFWNSSVLPSGVIATAWTAYWDTVILEVDICFNDTYNWGDGTGGTMDVQTIALHEMGHWLKLRDLYGLGDENKVMYGLRAYGTQMRELSAGDRAGIVWIYGSAGPSAPVVQAGSDTTITVGSTFIRSGSFTDPDDETWTATVDYGDGGGPQPLDLNANKTFSLSHRYDQIGTYTVRVEVDDSGDLTGTDTVKVIVNPPSPVYVLYRGTDRYDTAMMLSQAAFPDPLPDGSGLVLAPGETFQEALCGAPLAAAYGGPVLLTPTVGLNNGVKAEIIRLAPDYVVCIGLSETIKDAVQAALGPDATVTAIRGNMGNVYDMSYKVAKALKNRVGNMSQASAIVTRGDLFPDAIGVSPLACAQLWPILLTDSGGGEDLHASSTAALYDLNITTAIKVGTYASLPAGVTGIANLSGADRYYTNRNVALWGEANAGLTFDHIGLATGDKFPDALASGPYLAKDQGILLLSPLYGPLPSCIGDTLTAKFFDIRKVTLVAMIEPVISQAKALLP